MTVDWLTELIGITAFAIMVILFYFIIKGSKPRKYSKETMKWFNKSPRTYFFFNFSIGFFIINVMMDIYAILIHSLIFNLYVIYIVPLCLALINQMYVKHASKFKKSKDERN